MSELTSLLGKGLNMRKNTISRLIGAIAAPAFLTMALSVTVVNTVGATAAPGVEVDCPGALPTPTSKKRYLL